MEYLPIGTVVKTKLMDKTLMVYGRKQHSEYKNADFDYVAVLYPEGNINEKFNFFFNQDDIENIIYMGYQNEEEERFQNIILNKGSAKDE